MLKSLLDAFKDIAKDILGKLALLFLFLLLFAGGSALTRAIFRWLHYNDAGNPKISDRIANFIALLGSLAITGIVFAVYHARKKANAKCASSVPPTTLASVSPLRNQDD